MEVLIGVMVLLSIMGGVLHYLDLGVTKKLVQYGSDTVLLIQHEWLEQKKRNEGKKLQKVKNEQAARTVLFKEAAERKEKLKQAMKNRRKTLSGLKASQSDMLAQIRSRAVEWNHEINESVEVGPNVTVTKSGGRHVDVGKLLSSPKVQKQLKAMDKLFKGEVLRALKFGKEPPLLVGKGIYTKTTLKQDWNDEWQAIANDLDIHLWGKPKVKVGSPATHMKSLSPLANDFFARPSPPPNPPSPDSLVQQKLKLEIEKLKLQKENLMRMEIMEQKSAAEQKAANDHAALTNKIFSQLYEEQEGITIDKDGMWRRTTNSGGPR